MVPNRRGSADSIVSDNLPRCVGCHRPRRPACGPRKVVNRLQGIRLEIIGQPHWALDIGNIPVLTDREIVRRDTVLRPQRQPSHGTGVSTSSTISSISGTSLPLKSIADSLCPPAAFREIAYPRNVRIANRGVLADFGIIDHLKTNVRGRVRPVRYCELESHLIPDTTHPDEESDNRLAAVKDRPLALEEPSRPTLRQTRRGRRIGERDLDQKPPSPMK